MQRRFTNLLVQSFELGRARAVRLSRAALVKHSRAQLKDLRKFVYELLRKWVRVVDQQYAAAERIKTFKILLPANAVQSPALGDCREAARDQRSRQKAEQRHPILRI